MGWLGVRRVAVGVAVAVLAATGGCVHVPAPFRVGSLDRRAPAWTLSSPHSDHQLIECVQRVWEGRGAQVATYARPDGVQLVARSATYSTLLFAQADIVAFAPTRRLSVRTTRRSRGYAQAARVCV